MPDSAFLTEGHIHVALPVMDEVDGLPLILYDIHAQQWTRYTVTMCVNQPDSWWRERTKQTVCQNNKATLAMLAGRGHPLETVIDRSSQGNGWKKEKHGVGWARKTLMDHISAIAAPGDIIVSLDADTRVQNSYFFTVANTFFRHPEALGAVSAYYHKLPDDSLASRAILRYEIYMRYYLLNLWRIHSPYAFTALGSAMACRVGTYRRVGGLTPKASGEDFYFLQKLRKSGPIVSLTTDPVYPAARFSSRVGFGTGPAMISGAAGDWDSYPIYASHLFDEIEQAYRLFPDAMESRAPEHRVFRFLAARMPDSDPFAPLRKNFTKKPQFIKACHEKLDGLRILQYLKSEQKRVKGRDEDHLLEWMDRFYPGRIEDLTHDRCSFAFADAPLEQLNRIRDFLFEEEMRYRITSGPLLPDWLLPEA